MKKRLIAALLLIMFIFRPSGLSAEESLTSLDSLYLHAIEEFYAFAENHVEAIWPGMVLSPVCLYREGGPAFLYRHPNPPASFRRISADLYQGRQEELQLFGSTILSINDELTAIADYGSDQIVHPEEVLAVMFHEMHHVYQRKHIRQLRYDNPAQLMVYPEDYRNSALKLHEQAILYALTQLDDHEGFRNLLNQYYSLRLARADIIGDFTEYEKAVENAEGPAFFTEYLFFKLYTDLPKVLQHDYLQRNFLSILTRPYYGRDGLRKRHLASGFALCYLLDKHFDNWKQDYYASGDDLYDFFVKAFEPQQTDLPDLNHYYRLSAFHTQNLIREKEAVLRGFFEQEGVHLVLNFKSIPGFRGFDPMNARALASCFCYKK